MQKWKLCMQNLTKERKQPPVVFLSQAIFYNIFILCLWVRIIRTSDHEFMNFLTILIMVTEQLYWRLYCGCFRFIWLWLLLSVLKRCAERCILQLYHTSLSPDTWSYLYVKLSRLFLETVAMNYTCDSESYSKTRSRVQNL